MKNSWFLGAALVSAVLVACGGSSDGTTAVPTRAPDQPSTEAEATYFDEIAGVEVIIVKKLVAVDEALEMTWPTRGRLLSVQADAEFYATIEAMLQQAEEIEAPERFAADHDLYVQSLRDTLVLAQDHDQAIADEDLVASVLALQGGWRVRATLLLQVSPRFCDAVTPNSVGASCQSIDLPGGPYGVQLEDAFRRYAADFSPRVGSFRTAYTAEERIDVILEVNSDIIRSIEQARDEIADIEPPEEFAQDHARLVQYLNDILEVARAITQAAEDGDDGQILEEFGRSGDVVEGVGCDFSSEFRPIVAFFFPAVSCDE
jgi:hypothetical protein